MEFEEALEIRFKQRQQYLENSDFERLSTIIPDKNAYRGKRDNFLFIYLLNGYEDELWQCLNMTNIEKTFLEKYNRHGINWHGIYDYYQARIQSINDGQWFDPNDNELQNVITILEKHKDKIIKNYTTF